MTPSTSAPRFGRAGGPSTQHVREYGDLSTSAILVVAATTTVRQPMLPATTGGDYYLIWGYSVVTSNASGAEFGFIETTDGAEDIGAYAVTAAGPLALSLPIPVKLATGQGVGIKPLVTITAPQKCIAMVYYTLVQG